MISHTVSFYIDKEAGKPDGKLRMRVRWGGGNQVAVGLGLRVEREKWSAESQRVKANTSHGRFLHRTSTPRFSSTKGLRRIPSAISIRWV